MKYLANAYSGQISVYNRIAYAESNDLNELKSIIEKKVKQNNRKNILIEIMKEFADGCYDTIEMYRI
jgi:hypothetical protein